MRQDMAYTFGVIWASIKKDVKIALADRTFTLMSILTPINMFLLMSLFVAGSNSVPVAVVMQDTGPYAQRFYAALNSTHVLRLQQVNSEQQADDLLRAGHIVAIITVVSQLDQRLQQKQPIEVKFRVNNLNTSLTDVIRRAIAASITNFYASTFPGALTVLPVEHDIYAQDTSYIQYLAVPILVLGSMISSIVQAGTSMANEWEKQTIKEGFLSPTGYWTLVVGKMLGSFIINLIAVLLIMIILVTILHIAPLHWAEVISFCIVDVLLFISLGTLLGTLFKRRKDVVIIAMSLAFPLFFLSSPFGPLTFNSGPMRFIASLTPTYYAIELLQYAFHNFPLDTYSASIGVCILGSYILLFALLATIALKRGAVARS